MKMSPIAVFVVVMLGGAIAGVLGAIFAIPVAATILAITDYLRQRDVLLRDDRRRGRRSRGPRRDRAQRRLGWRRLNVMKKASAVATLGCHRNQHREAHCMLYAGFRAGARQASGGTGPWAARRGAAPAESSATLARRAPSRRRSPSHESQRTQSQVASGGHDARSIIDRQYRGPGSSPCRSDGAIAARRRPMAKGKKAARAPTTFRREPRTLRGGFALSSGGWPVSATRRPRGSASLSVFAHAESCSRVG